MTKRKARRPIFRFLIRLLPVLLVLFLGWVVYLDAVVTSQFEGRRWEIPSRVYARPLELYEGASVTPGHLQWELQQLGYSQRTGASRPGSYQHSGRQFTIATRGFAFPDGVEPERRLRLTIEQDRVVDFQALGGGGGVARLEPMQIGGIYPAHNEDRILVRLEQVPPELIKALLQTEDRDFFNHWGIAPLSILRAAWANLKAGAVVQGGSTLTQQLVKNFYLSREQTLSRKATEAIMALLLEWHYDKKALLQAYLNEVYLGQAGRRSINGFGLASQFYFGKPVQSLELHESALLVAMVKGPSYYDPRRHPERARKRRNLVIDEMARAQMISPGVAEQAKRQSLDVVGRPNYTNSRYPAYIDLVRRHLSRDYRQEDLQSEGLKIFTTLDPVVQKSAETALSSRLERLDRGDRKTPLQGAMVVTGKDSGEVLAVVGGRETRFAGFNRAVDAKRPVGSLMKPVIYLTALSDPERYTLITPLQDKPFAVVADDGQRWEPKNYGGEVHGEVPLHEAFSHSYNLATVRVGLDVGIDAVQDNLRRLGADMPLSDYPSILLGAQSMAPVDVAAVYQSIAASGFKTPLRTIRDVATSDGEVLSRYSLDVHQVAEPGPVHLVHYAMQEVMHEGTGRSAYRFLPESLNAAGKTGTTNDSRDSWFAGFTGDYLAVVWVGRDNNEPTRLTGATGALPVWADLMRRLPQHSFQPVAPANVRYHWVDAEAQALTSEGCPDARKVPFIVGSEPQKEVNCSGAVTRRIKNWFEGLF
ncbi:penicillin-binding protein 1B [Marinobacteraceae bacterium S3BR75-40.1]